MWKKLLGFFIPFSSSKMSCQAGQFRIFTDNRVALFCLRRMDSLHSPPLDKVTRQLILFCHQRNISFGACPHLRQDEYSCRPGFTSGAPCHRVDAWSRLIRTQLPKGFLLSLKRISLLQGPLWGYPVTFSLCRSRGILSECLGSFFLSIGIISNQYMLSLHLLSSQGLLEGFANSGDPWS